MEKVDRHIVAGMDVGFRKTGVTIFHMMSFGVKLHAATTIAANERSGGGSLRSDLADSWAMQSKLQAYLDEAKVTAIFAEFPTGGAQSGRAARCMGMATALCSSIFYSNNYAWEIMVPSEIEKALGFYITNQEKTKLGLKGGKLRDRRKALLKKTVIDRFPEFEGWPDRAAEAEDAYDSAAAFMAAEHMGPDCLYSRLLNTLK
jgi:hypothetical protein